MHSVIKSSERAALEQKLRTVFGAGVATTALLRVVDAVVAAIEIPPQVPVVLEAAPEVPVEPTPEVPVEPTPEVQVVESSP